MFVPWHHLLGNSLCFVPLFALNENVNGLLKKVQVHVELCSLYPGTTNSARGGVRKKRKQEKQVDEWKHSLDETRLKLKDTGALVKTQVGFGLCHGVRVNKPPVTSLLSRTTWLSNGKT